MKREDSPSSILTLPSDALFEPRAPMPAASAAGGEDADLVVGQIDPLIDQVDNLHAFARTGSAAYVEDWARAADAQTRSFLAKQL